MKRLAQKHSQSVIPLTILAGAVLGCTAALLFAPKKGSEARKWINDRLDELKNRATEQKSATSDHVATMHPVETLNVNNKPSSKAASMVNHLKQHAQNDNRQDGQF